MRSFEQLRFAVFLVALLGLSASGCANRTEERPTADIDKAPAARASPVSAVTLRAIDASQLADLLQKHRGQVVLVDLWATWCKPCVEIFPHTVQLQRTLADQGFVGITVSLDQPEDEAAVKTFLQEQNALTENYLVADPDAETTWKTLSIRNGLPNLKVYDRSGKLRRTFPGDDAKVRVEEVDRIIKELLAEPSAAP